MGDWGTAAEGAGNATTVADAASTAGNTLSATEALGDTGTAASQIANSGYALDGANSLGGVAGTTGNIYGNMADLGGSGTAPEVSGFSYNVSEPIASQGPSVANANMQEFGKYEPSFLDKVGKTLEDFQSGKGQNMVEAWKNRGLNARTAGYAVGKLEGFTKGGGNGSSQPQIVNNIAYQQPENEYLRRRRGY